MNIVKINDVSIDIHDGPIGISISGGADSSILLYILMKYATGPIHAFTCSSKQKNRVSPHVALNVIGKCIDLTGNDNIRHHTFFVEEQTYSALISPLSKILDEEYVNFMYTATTSLPPRDILSTFINPSPLMDKRDPGIIRPVYNGKFYVPFFNINKRDICRIYETLGVKDHLYHMTRSCEDLVMTEGHCGRCWWCEERLWGFGEV